MFDANKKPLFAEDTQTRRKCICLKEKTPALAEEEKHTESMNYLNVHMEYHGHVKLENGLHGYIVWWH